MHSSGCRAQNSTHPGGGCVTAETKTWAGCSGPATAGGGAIALAASAAIKTVPDFTLKTLELKAPIHSTPDVTAPPLTIGTQQWPSLGDAGKTRRTKVPHCGGPR
jgi:hypothetical protein